MLVILLACFPNPLLVLKSTIKGPEPYKCYSDQLKCDKLNSANFSILISHKKRLNNENNLAFWIDGGCYLLWNVK